MKCLNKSGKKMINIYLPLSFLLIFSGLIFPIQSEAQNIFEAQEEIRIGTLDGEFEYLFADISDLASGTCGTVFVADSPAGDAVVRMFDSEGSL